MIKNLIFDLDNTIILDKDSDSEFYKEALRNCGYDEGNYYNIYMAIDEYDKLITEESMYYNKKEMLNTINQVLHTDYSINLVDEIIRVIGQYWTKRIILKENIVKELVKKYNLYIYTNYFHEAQEKRIENIGYLNYFKKVFGADEYGSKPFKKSFENVLKEMNSKPEECIMIGDDKTRDIMAANNIGMKSILYDYNGKRDKKEIELKNYIVINDMEELLKIL